MHSLTSSLEPLRLANDCAGRTLYEITFHGFDGAHVVAQDGFSVSCDPAPQTSNRLDMVIVVGGRGTEHYQHPQALSWLRLQDRRGALLLGVGPGAFILARSGLLDAQEATTHWSSIAGFRERFPKVYCTEALFCASGRVMTCAGGMAASEIMLALIEREHGSTLTQDVTDRMVMPAARPGETGQRLRRGRSDTSLNPVVTATIALIEDHIGEPLPVPEIAGRLGLSQRHLERQFRADTGCSVVQFGRRIRLQHARVLLQTTGLTILEVAAACGFNSVPHFSTAFKALFNQTPGACRASPGETRDAASGAQRMES